MCIPHRVLVRITLSQYTASMQHSARRKGSIILMSAIVAVTLLKGRRESEYWGGNEQSSVGGQPDPGAPQPASLPELSEWPQLYCNDCGPWELGLPPCTGLV